MNGLYHVNPATGGPGRRQVHHGRCPFNTDDSGINHFNTRGGVIDASERIIRHQETKDGQGNNRLFHKNTETKKNQTPKEIADAVLYSATWSLKYGDDADDFEIDGVGTIN